MKKELERLDFPYTIKSDTFKVTIPRRRLDIDANVNDIAEEIGRLYGYHNLVSTLPRLTTKRGVYVGDVKIRKEISKRWLKKQKLFSYARSAATSTRHGRASALTAAHGTP